MLEDLKAGDTFNIVTFESEARAFAAERMVPVSDRSIFAALKFMDQIETGGGTNIYSALVKSLIILAQNKKSSNRENVIYFLTDGAPTAGVQDLNVILNTVRFVAQQNQIAINTIAFGDEVNIFYNIHMYANKIVNHKLFHILTLGITCSLMRSKEDI